MERVLVIGDVIDDIIVVPDGTIRTNTDTNAKITQTLGGSAGNIASWASHCGAEVTFIGCVGEKDIQRVVQEFESYGVHAELQISTSNPTGSIVVLVEGDSRSMLTDRGANKDLVLENLTIDYLSDFSFVLLSGYTLFGRSDEEIQRLVYKVQEAGSLLVVDPGSSGYIKDFGLEEFSKALSGVDIIIPNEEEFEILGTLAQITIVTKGKFGVDVYVGGIKTESLEALEVSAIDPTGAGDAFAGSLLAHLAKGEELGSSVANAIKTAALAVTTIGARPQL